MNTSSSVVMTKMMLTYLENSKTRRIGLIRYYRQLIIKEFSLRKTMYKKLEGMGVVRFLIKSEIIIVIIFSIFHLWLFVIPNVVLLIFMCSYIEKERKSRWHKVYGTEDIFTYRYVSNQEINETVIK